MSSETYDVKRQGGETKCCFGMVLVVGYSFALHSLARHILRRLSHQARLRHLFRNRLVWEQNDPCARFRHRAHVPGSLPL